MFHSIAFLISLAVIVCSLPFEDTPKEIQQLTGEKLVEHINKQGDWHAVYYPQFKGQSKEDLKKYLGALKKPSDLPQRGTLANLAESTSELSSKNLPSSFDAVEAWPECAQIIGLIQDQSQCSCCWAVATTSAMSDRLCIASKSKIKTSISIIDLLECCSYCGYQCQGGYLDEALYYFTTTGIVTGSNYTEKALCKPYPISPCKVDPNNQKWICPNAPSSPFKCNQQCQKSYVKETYMHDRYYGKKMKFFKNDNAAVMAELVRNGPVIAQFRLYEDFYYYKGGIYKYTGGNYTEDHIVRIVGYGTENGIDYWKVANSWNTFWGENGYFRILRGTNECGFEGYIFSVLADIPRSLSEK